MYGYINLLVDSLANFWVKIIRSSPGWFGQWSKPPRGSQRESVLRHMWCEWSKIRKPIFIYLLCSKGMILQVLRFSLSYFAIIVIPSVVWISDSSRPPPPPTQYNLLRVCCPVKIPWYQNWLASWSRVLLENLRKGCLRQPHILCNVC
jgi:hypothetical protein